MRVTRVLRLLVGTLFMVPAVGWAAEFHGSTSTELTWYNDLYGGREVDLSQYLNFSATNIDPDGKLTVNGYGKVTQGINSGGGLNGQLYYLYGDMKDIYNMVDARVGRQFVNLSAGSALIDGLQANIKNIGPVGFSILGGRNVIMGVDGEAGHGGDAAFGLAAYLVDLKKTTLEVSWLRKWDSGDLATDTLGVNASQILFDNIKVYGNGRYDLVSEAFSEALGGIKYFPMPELIITAEYYQSYPTFNSNDIYSVFAVDKYREGVFRADYGVTDWLGVHGGYNREFFGEAGLAANVYNVGCTIKPIKSVSVNLEYDRHQGADGNQDGGQIDVAYDVTKDLQVAGGFSMDVYRYIDSAADATASNPSNSVGSGNATALPTTSSEYARKYWLGAKYKLAKNVSTSFRIEDDVNSTYYNDVSGRFTLDYNF